MNKVLRATLVSAVVITTVIGIASFVLSFAALWDLATMAGVPRNLSWLWPVIVDGTILQATISVIALAQFDTERSGRRFFWAVLVTAALVSIGANALHAFISQTGTLHPALSAAIATVAPVSLLAATHGLGVLVRVPAGRDGGARQFVDAVPDAPAEPEPEATPLPVDPATTAAPVPRLIPTQRGPIARSMPDRDPLVGTETGVSATETEIIGTDTGIAGRETTAEAAAAFGIAGVEDPLEDVDRWILDRDRAEDLFPVDAP